MKVVEFTGPGGPEVLKITERPMPKAGSGEVLIKAQAIGINRPDVLQRLGSYPPPAGASDIPGLELAGTIVGGDLTNTQFKLNDEVCALVSGGAYAEYCVAPAAQCLPVPKGFSMVQAAAIPETYFTVWSNVFDRGNLQPGESLLVHGGASGIGTTAISLAKAFGNPVYATVGSDDRVQAIEALGCTKGINYKTQDFVAEIKSLTNKRGVNVILDMVAGDYIERDIQALADEGRIVIIALLGGAQGSVNCAQILTRRLVITGSTLRPRPIAFKASIAQSLQAKVWPLFENGSIEPIIYKTFAFQDIQQAHALMDAGDQIGKIVLTV